MIRRGLVRIRGLSAGIGQELNAVVDFDLTD
jgi:hypothetical protein